MINLPDVLKAVAAMDAAKQVAQAAPPSFANANTAEWDAYESAVGKASNACIAYVRTLAQPGAVGDCRKAGPGKGLCDRCAAAADYEHFRYTQPQATGLSACIDDVLKMLAHYAAHCCYTEEQKVKWPNNAPYTEEQVLAKAAELRRLASGPAANPSQGVDATHVSQCSIGEPQMGSHQQRGPALAAPPVVVDGGKPWETLDADLSDKNTGTVSDAEAAEIRAALKAPPAPDSPASIRASLEGIEPVGAGDGRKYDSRYWQEGIYGNANVVTYNGEDVKPVCRIEDATLRATVIAKHNATVATAPAEVGDGELHKARVRLAVAMVNAKIPMSQQMALGTLQAVLCGEQMHPRDVREGLELVAKLARLEATTPAALVDDATTFAAFDAASNTYDASIKIRGDSHKRALLEACRAYTAALSAKGDGQ